MPDAAAEEKSGLHAICRIPVVRIRFGRRAVRSALCVRTPRGALFGESPSSAWVGLVGKQPVVLRGRRNGKIALTNRGARRVAEPALHRM